MFDYHLPLLLSLWETPPLAYTFTAEPRRAEEQNLMLDQEAALAAPPVCLSSGGRGGGWVTGS